MRRAFRRGALVGVIGLGGLGLVGACSADRTPAPTLANGEDSGAGPPDGAVNAARDGNVVGLTDAAESGADAGDAGWAPPPPACPQRTFIDEAVIARAAAALEACTSDDGMVRTTTYLRGVQSGYGYPGGEATVACIAAVTNGCAGVAACLGYSPFAGGETCGTCAGDTAAYCPSFSSWQGLYACNKFAGTCDAGKCAYPQNPLCSGATRCDANGRPVHCEVGGSKTETQGAACPSFGLACNPNSLSGGASCTGLGTSCDSVTYSFGGTGYFDVDVRAKLGNTCNGNVLPACVDGKRANLDCTCFGAGFGCQTAPLPDSGPAERSFCGAASECNPGYFKLSCDGDTVVFCNAGKIARIDCTAMGFPGCSAVKPARGCLPDTFALPH